MRLPTLRVLLCGLLLASPAAAQEQRGSIQGVIKDAQGGVLPGVTVEARSSTGSVVTVHTDPAGIYRFPALAPGLYEVAANLTGFAPRKVSDIEVLLGQIKKVDMTLPVAGVAETVQVIATSPVIDVKQSTKTFSIREDQIEKLPRGRDFSSIVTQVPGTNKETRFGEGISIDGSSAAENRYIIDGVETTALVGGQQGKSLITDFIEEVQVKSSGYQAEYGGSTGGVINVITKSGTNQLRGQLGTYFSGDKLETGHPVGGLALPRYAGGRQTLRLKLTNADEAEYVQFPEDSWTQWEPGFGLGGPISRDRVWFFGSYQPELRSTDRTVTLRANNQTISRNENVKVHYTSGNVVSQLSDATRLRVSANLNPSKTTGLLPDLDGSDSPRAIYDINTVRKNYTMSANLDYTVSPRLFLSIRGGYFYSNRNTEGVPQAPRFIFQTSNIGFVGLSGTPVPANLQQATGFADPPTNDETQKDALKRTQIQGDATYYASLGGEHTFKAGVQIDRIGNEVFGGESGNRVQLFWGRSFRGQRGDFGYYRVRSNGVQPKRGFFRFGDISVNNIGLFVQDAWTIGNRLTLNMGIRTENEHVPSFTTEEGIASTAILWNFKDKLAPRAGFAYDILGDGRWKAYGSWGMFYDIMKLELPRGSFGGEKWLEYWYTLDAADWPSLVAAPSCPPACPGRRLLGPVDFRHPSNAPGENTIDPNLKPMRLQEAVFGFEHEMTSTVGLGMRYVHKQIDKAIEDVGALDAQQNEIYKIANPGFSTAEFFFPEGSNQALRWPKARRDYDSVEFFMRKRLADNWALSVSYLYSRLFGNYAGLAQSDEPGRFSPNVGRAFDYPLMAFDETGQGVYGVLATDRPHQFKTQFLYDFGEGTSVGLNQFVESGIPVTREAAFIPGNGYPLMYKGRKSDGRNDVFTQSDFYVQHQFRLPSDQRLTVSLNVLNLFNQKTGLDKFRTQLASGEAVAVDEVQFYRGINTEALIRAQRLPGDPRFLQPNVFQLPITARIGASWRF